jgi:hypothetical protein
MGLGIAKDTSDFSFLVDALNTINWTMADEPLPDAEVRGIAESLWSMKERGTLYAKGEPRFGLRRSDKDALMHSPHAFLLYADLVDLHGWRGGESFVLANATTERYGWDVKRLQRTITELVEAGLLEVTNAGGRVRDADGSKWKGIPRQVRLL